MTSALRGASPAKKKTMDFCDAMREAIAGKKIRRAEWPEGEYGFTKDGTLMIHKDGDHQWIIKDGDWLSNDWLVIK